MCGRDLEMDRGDWHKPAGRWAQGEVEMRSKKWAVTKGDITNHMVDTESFKWVK